MLQQVVLECVMLFVFVLSPVVQLISHYKLMAVLGWEASGEFLRSAHFWLAGEEGVLERLLDGHSFVRIYL